MRLGRLVQAAQVALDPAVAQAYTDLCEQLTQDGVVWVDIDVPLWQATAMRQAGLLLSERDAAVHWTTHLGADLTGLSDGFARMLRYPERAGAAKLAQAQAAGEKLAGTTVKLTQKAGVDGRLFGSVTNFDIAEELVKAGYSLTKAQVRMPHGPIKVVGDSAVSVSLHTDVVVEVNVSVYGETA